MDSWELVFKSIYFYFIGSSGYEIYQTKRRRDGDDNLRMARQFGN
jgi:hypothetical protein